MSKIVTKKGTTKYIIKIDPLPKNCKECPFYLHYNDDEYGGYDYDYCQFGAKDNWGAALKRVSDCPLN